MTALEKEKSSVEVMNKIEEGERLRLLPLLLFCPKTCQNLLSYTREQRGNSKKPNKTLYPHACAGSSKT